MKGIEPEHETRYFAYARHAIAEALRLCQCGPQDFVLVPEFICRDVLASIHQMGAQTAFYEVDRSLSPVNLSLSPVAKVVLAVNYFGFPQNLEPFLDYALRTGAVIIEDNAHGFLSNTDSGVALGTRTGLGTTSIRKTFRLINGAALHINDAQLVPAAQPQLKFTSERVSYGFLVRQVFARVQRTTRIPVFSLLKYGLRTSRYWQTGSRIPIADPNSESILPLPIAPHQSLQHLISSLDPITERNRRQTLFSQVEKRLQHLAITPIFSQLPSGTSPYGYAFIGTKSDVGHVQRAVRGLSVEVMQWPDLPGVIDNAIEPDHFYRNIWIVNFL